MTPFPVHPSRRGLVLGVVLATAVSSAAYATGALRPAATPGGYRIAVTPIGAHTATGSADEPDKLVVLAGRSRRLRVTLAGSPSRGARLRVIGVPDGVQATLGQDTLSAKDSTATVTVDVARSMRRVTFPLTIRAEDRAGRVRRATVLVNVRYLVAVPRVVSVQAGDTATLALALRRTGAAQPTTLSADGLPAGVTASFDPSSTPGPRATMRLATDGARTPAGTHHLRVVSRWGADGVSFTALVLKVRSAPTTAFRVTGSVAGLAPGVARPVDLRLEGTPRGSLRVLDLRTAITKVTAPAATAALPCSLGDFAVTQYRGGPVTLPAGQTRTLSSLGVPASAWPQITMINRPANQDGCQRATLRLAFLGSAVG